MDCQLCYVTDMYNSMMSAAPTVKITATAPFAKLESDRSYWIRVVQNRECDVPAYAIAAIRCENHEEIHWLSTTAPTPAEAAARMFAGFQTPDDVDNVGFEVISRLITDGSATWAGAQSWAA